MRKFNLLFLLILIIFTPINLIAYEVKTHRAISYWALHHKQSTIDKFLKEDLLWNDGLQKFTNSNVENACRTGCSLENWLLEGSEREDDGIRARNHFYNPLKPQTPGLDEPLLPGSPYLDSLTWMWNGADEDSTQYFIGQEDPRIYTSSNFNFKPLKIPKNLWSWEMARYYYFRSLVSYLPETKNPEFYIPNSQSSGQAKTFFAIGHLTHLLEDLGQPQHTRNDSHTPLEGSPYEKYCEKSYGNNEQLSELANLVPIPNFKSSSPGKNFNGIGITNDFPKPDQRLDGLPRELKMFWDSDQYTGKDGWSAVDSLGLAEYSNAFFVTDDTMPFDGKLPNGMNAKKISNTPDKHHQFPYPTLKFSNIPTFKNVNSNLSSDSPVSKFIFLEGQNFKCNSKTVNQRGIADYEFNHNKIKSLLTYQISKTNLFGEVQYEYRIGLCDSNYDAYAKQLLPKTISYAAGLLEYFFRGRLGVITTPVLSNESIGNSEYGEEYYLTVTNLTTSTEALSGVNYLASISNKVNSFSIEELKQLNKEPEKLKEIGRQLRKKGALWGLLEDQPDSKLRIPVVVDIFQSETNPRGFTGYLNYQESFTFKARLIKGRKYTLVFKGTIGNETQNAIAAKSFILE